ncbi:ATP-binding protein [Streptomyces sp. NPDC048386]
MTSRVLDPVLWLLTLAVVAAVAMAVRFRAASLDGKRRVASLETSLRMERAAVEARDDEVRHLAHQQVPSLIHAVLSGQQAATPPALHPELSNSDFGRALAEVLRTVHETTVQSADRAENVTRTTLGTFIRAIQPLVNELQGAVEGMVERHHDPKVLADAIEISHGGNQLARRLQAFSVLIGSWPGRQRDPAPLIDVVRGGVSRIRDYDRIEITGEAPFAVTSRAVEPIVLSLAELLDNAARHSEPGTKVQVWYVSAANGVTVFIDDAGIGMTPENRANAGLLLTGGQQIWITQMRNPPQLGFVTAGQYAARYGFRAGADQVSATGGVRAWVFIPQELLVPLSDVPKAEQARMHASVTAFAPAPPAEPDTAHDVPPQYPTRADSGLPQRTRQGARPRHAAAPVHETQPPSDGGRAVGAFLRGVERAGTQGGQRSGTGPHHYEEEGNHTDDER